MLQSFVQLVVQVGQPQLAVLRRPLPCHRLDDLSDLLQVRLPDLPVVEEIDVHKLVDHVHDVAMNVA